MEKVGATNTRLRLTQTHVEDQNSSAKGASAQMDGERLMEMLVQKKKEQVTKKLSSDSGQDEPDHGTIVDTGRKAI